MKRWFLAGLLIFFVTLAHAELSAELSESEVSLDEPFKLTITQENTQDSGIPDLTPLQKEFNVIGTERSINYLLIDGQARSTKQWIILLSAKKEGQLRIPAISIGQQSTKPLIITVTASPTATGAQQSTARDKDKDKDVLLATELSNDSPYVNQQVIYTVKLYTSRRLLDADYQGPQIEDALIIPLGNARRYQSVENNRVYAVEEQRYAIFPQKSGDIEVISPTFKALVYDVIPRRVSVDDKSKHLSVKPIPEHYQGRNWLPAQNIRLSETYEPDTISFTQGHTLTRTITIESTGIPAQLLPPLQIESNEQFNAYPEKPEESNTVRHQQLLGRTSTKITYLFSKPGKITIPEVRLPWFNTTTGEEAVAVLPARDIEVKPAAVTAQQAPPSASGSNAQALKQNTASAPSKPVNQNPEFLSPGWILAALFALAWFVTLFLWFWQKRKQQGSKNGSKSALKDLQLACQQHHRQKAKEALLQWFKGQWPEAQLLNLTDLSKRIRDPRLKKQINLLSQSLYSHNTSQWQGDELWRALLAYKNTVADKKSRTNPLPPIHPF